MHYKNNRVFLIAGILLVSLLISACVPEGIHRNDLPRLTKGMSPVIATQILSAQPACQLGFEEFPRAKLDVYRLLSASYSVQYYLLYRYGALTYWGTPAEFQRRDDPNVRVPAEYASFLLSVGAACKNGAALMVHKK